jgi:hypothetical protein
MKYFKQYREFVNESGFHSQPELTEREYSDEERAKLADKGFALPDGSYPIKDVDDLKNAIQAYGRAKDQAAAAKHIVKRAKALGAEDLVPTSEDFQKSLKEAVTMDAVYIHQITGSGQDSAQNFIDDNGLDGKKLANYVKQHRDSKEKIDVRDMIAGVGIGANKKLRDRFLKQFKESVNESLSSSDKKKFEDFFKNAIGKRVKVTTDDYSEEGKLETQNGMYKVDDGDMWIEVDYLVSTNDMKIVSMSPKKLVYRHGDTWTIEIK